MFGQPCDNLATTLSQPCDSFKIQGCAKVVTRLHCGNLVTMLGQPCHNLATMFGQPCHNLATVSKYKVVPRLCQGCDKVVKKHCGKVVTTLSFLYGVLPAQTLAALTQISRKSACRQKKEY